MNKSLTSNNLKVTSSKCELKYHQHQQRQQKEPVQQEQKDDRNEEKQQHQQQQLQQMKKTFLDTIHRNTSTASSTVGSRLHTNSSVLNNAKSKLLTIIEQKGMKACTTRSTPTAKNSLNKVETPSLLLRPQSRKNDCNSLNNQKPPMLSYSATRSKESGATTARTVVIATTAQSTTSTPSPALATKVSTARAISSTTTNRVKHNDSSKKRICSNLLIPLPKLQPPSPSTPHQPSRLKHNLIQTNAATTINTPRKTAQKELSDNFAKSNKLKLEQLLKINKITKEDR